MIVSEIKIIDDFSSDGSRQIMDQKSASKSERKMKQTLESIKTVSDKDGPDI